MKSVIIIEDNLIPSLSMESMLKDKGYRVDGKLVSAEGVVDLVKEKDPTLIIMDIRLEGQKDGVEVATDIREFSEVPIMFVSALTDATTLGRIETIRNSISISKPFTSGDFFTALEKITSD